MNYKLLMFANQIRGLNARNIDGKNNKAIVHTIQEICKNHFDELIQLCQREEDIAKICSLPIPELLQLWRQNLTSDDGTDCFLQVMKQLSLKEVTSETTDGRSPFNYGVAG